MLSGKCLCGGITYKLNGMPQYLYNCHCRECRAFSGSSIATLALVKSDNLNVQDPNNNLVRFESSPGVRRCFCNNCGSSMYSYLESNREYSALCCGTIIDPPDMKINANVHVSEKCPWIEIDKTLQCFEYALQFPG